MSIVWPQPRYFIGLFSECIAKAGQFLPIILYRDFTMQTSPTKGPVTRQIPPRHSTDYLHWQHRFRGRSGFQAHL